MGVQTCVDRDSGINTILNYETLCWKLLRWNVQANPFMDILEVLTLKKGAYSMPMILIKNVDYILVTCRLFTANNREIVKSLTFVLSFRFISSTITSCLQLSIQYHALVTLDISYTLLSVASDQGRYVPLRSTYNPYQPPIL